MFRVDPKSHAEFWDAVGEKTAAEQFFDYAEPELIVECCHRINAARARVDRVTREIKKAPASVEAKQGARKKLLNFIIPQFRRLRK